MSAVTKFERDVLIAIRTWKAGPYRLQALRNLGNTGELAAVSVSLMLKGLAKLEGGELVLTTTGKREAEANRKKLR